MTRELLTLEDFVARVYGPHNHAADEYDAPLSGMATDRESWRVSAACRGLDPDLFFPSRGVSTDRARSVCAGCPVRVECRTAGLGERFGIWGGESEKQRRQQRKAAA